MWKAKTETNGWGTGKRWFDESENECALIRFGFTVDRMGDTERNAEYDLDTKRGCGGGEVKGAGNDGHRYNEKDFTGGWDSCADTGFGAAPRGVTKEFTHDFYQ